MSLVFISTPLSTSTPSQFKDRLAKITTQLNLQSRPRLTVTDTHHNFHCLCTTTTSTTTSKTSKKTSKTTSKTSTRTSTTQCVLIAVTSTEYPARIAFQCLDEISFEFSSGTATRTWIESIERRFASAEEVDVLTRVRGQVDRTTGLVQRDIEMLVRNGDRLKELQGKTEEMVESAGRFSRTSTKLKRKLAWKNTKLKLIIAASVTAVSAALGGGVYVAVA